ncbi:ABC transporter permease [Rhizobium leucaenae]|uniref:Capsular polysaccharide transport system permease protein n=1 Tax=Rhizobium leucaenae TaxID=29450 RepID=A0A7W6ZZ67_9HYPH|nr:capsular biosynthesis protein [Rhizobium leucaenae]MBB4570850.1 capsular polysaccharide transport system permease protein [Rhizobium leucaenae]
MAVTTEKKMHTTIQAIARKKNVMNAVILRDMRTRFFNHGLGFAVVPLWPLVHMGVLILIHTMSHGLPPYGESTAVFYATGLVPTLTFMYVSRFMGYSLIMNRSMLAFPEVQVFDVMIGRAFLEIVAACIMLFLIVGILWALGEKPFPFDLERAVCCYLATILLAVGCGTVVGVASMFMPIIVTAYALIIILLYVSSGTIFVASNLPDPLANALAYNPLLVCVEWMRTAFYETYSDKLVDQQYVLAWGIGTLFCRTARRTRL